MYGPELIQAFREFKAIWDTDGKMNPGEVVDPYRLDENLRLGTTYNPRQLSTHFTFSDDEGSFAAAALRCVGVGKCRRTDGGTMCPATWSPAKKRIALAGVRACSLRCCK